MKRLFTLLTIIMVLTVTGCTSIRDSKNVENYNETKSNYNFDGFKSKEVNFKEVIDIDIDYIDYNYLDLFDLGYMDYITDLFPDKEIHNTGEISRLIDTKGNYSFPVLTGSTYEQFNSPDGTVSYKISDEISEYMNITIMDKSTAQGLGITDPVSFMNYVMEIFTASDEISVNLYATNASHFAIVGTTKDYSTQLTYINDPFGNVIIIDSDFDDLEAIEYLIGNIEIFKAGGYKFIKQPNAKSIYLNKYRINER